MWNKNSHICTLIFMNSQSIWYSCVRFLTENSAMIFLHTIKPIESLFPKVFDSSLDQKQMHGDSPYLIMFGKYL